MTNISRYVSDTHSLLWYLYNSPHLSSTARAIFKQAEAGQVVILIPLIVLAEIVFVAEKKRHPADLDKIMEIIEHNDGFEIILHNINSIWCLRDQTAVSEMHDRFIVCEALAQGAKVISKDKNIEVAGVVEAVW